MFKREEQPEKPVVGAEHLRAWLSERNRARAHTEQAENTPKPRKRSWWRSLKLRKSDNVNEKSPINKRDSA